MDDNDAIERRRPMTNLGRDEEREAEAKDAVIPEALLNEFDLEIDPELEQDGQDSGLDDQHLEIAGLLSR